jgi:hypothetical protein
MQLYSFFILAQDGGRCQRHALAALPPATRPGAHCIRGWVDPRAALDPAALPLETSPGSHCIGGWVDPRAGLDPAALPLETSPGAHCIRGWVNPKAGLDRCGKSRPPTGIRSPDRPARSQSLYRLSYRAYSCLYII